MHHPGQQTHACTQLIATTCCHPQVVFSECWWVGTKEANPEERKLPMPTELQAPVHDSYDFDFGAGAHGDAAHKEKGKEKGAGKRAASVLDQDSDEDDVQEDADEVREL